jgi:hypothetical protein
MGPAQDSTTLRSMAPTKPKVKRANGLRAEYRFDYAKAKANRFAQRTQPASG